MTASLENIFYNYLPQHSFQGNLNALLSAIMLVLVIIIAVDSAWKGFAYLKQHGFLARDLDKEVPTSEKEEALELDI